MAAKTKTFKQARDTLVAAARKRGWEVHSGGKHWYLVTPGGQARLRLRPQTIDRQRRPDTGRWGDGELEALDVDMRDAAKRSADFLKNVEAWARREVEDLEQVAAVATTPTQQFRSGERVLAPWKVGDEVQYFPAELDGIAGSGEKAAARVTFSGGPLKGRGAIVMANQLRRSMSGDVEVETQAAKTPKRLPPPRPEQLVAVHSKLRETTTPIRSRLRVEPEPRPKLAPSATRPAPDRPPTPVTVAVETELAEGSTEEEKEVLAQAVFIYEELGTPFMPAPHQKRAATDLAKRKLLRKLNGGYAPTAAGKAMAEDAPVIDLPSEEVRVAKPEAGRIKWNRDAPGEYSAVILGKPWYVSKTDEGLWTWSDDDEESDEQFETRRKATDDLAEHLTEERSPEGQSEELAVQAIVEEEKMEAAPPPPKPPPARKPRKPRVEDVFDLTTPEGRAACAQALGRRGGIASGESRRAAAQVGPTARRRPSVVRSKLRVGPEEGYREERVASYFPQRNEIEFVRAVPLPKSVPAPLAVQPSMAPPEEPEGELSETEQDALIEAALGAIE